MEPLNQATLNRLTLAKQGLLGRSTGDLVAWTGRICGLHAQVGTTPALSLLARLKGFQKSKLEAALERKRLVKRWFMRGTLHIVPTKHLSVYHQAFRSAWRSTLGRFLERHGLPQREVRLSRIYPAVMEVLKEGPLPRQEIEARVQELLPPDLRGREGFTGWGGSLKEMAYEGLLVHAPSMGPEAPLASMRQWLPAVNLDAVDEATALRTLASAYFAAYGPASAQDLAHWSGIPMSTLRPALQAIQDCLIDVPVIGYKSPLLTPREDARLLSRVEGSEAPPRFLPRFDVLLLGHRDRSRFIEATFVRRVVSITGQMEATFLISGRVAGTWGTARRGTDLIVNLRPFRPLPYRALAGLKEEAQLLSDFYGAKGAVVKAR